MGKVFGDVNSAQKWDKTRNDPRQFPGSDIGSHVDEGTINSLLNERLGIADIIRAVNMKANSLDYHRNRGVRGSDNFFF